jgi:hypothetical protein
MSYMMIITSYMMVPIIILFDILNFYLLFKFNKYKKSNNTNIKYEPYPRKIYVL